MPVRKIPKTFRSISGRFPSVKNGRCIGYESKLERDFYLRLEFDRSIASYEEQPLRLCGQVDGKAITYTPDCLIKYVPSGKPGRIVEIKYKSELIEKAAELEPRFSLARMHARDYDLEFVVVTDEDIYDGKLDSYRVIYRFARPPQFFEIKKHPVIEGLTIRGPQTLQFLLNLIAPDRVSQSGFMPSIYHLLFTGQIDADLSKPIDYTTILRISDGQNNFLKAR